MNKSHEEEEEELYFNFSASLRIFGKNIPIDDITQKLGINPTSLHKEGDKTSPKSNRKYEQDMWLYQAQINRDESLVIHLNELWHLFNPHIPYLKSLKRVATVDIFCGYRSNCDHAGFEVDYHSLKIFEALEVPFGVSVIIA